MTYLQCPSSRKSSLGLVSAGAGTLSWGCPRAQSTYYPPYHQRWRNPLCHSPEARERRGCAAQPRHIAEGISWVNQPRLRNGIIPLGSYTRYRGWNEHEYSLGWAPELCSSTRVPLQGGRCWPSSHRRGCIRASPVVINLSRWKEDRRP